MLSCLLVATLVSAAPSEQLSLREMCIRAPYVVLARPVDPEKPTRFVILAVLRGKSLKAGDTLRPVGLTEANTHSFDEKDPETRKPVPRRVANVLLFLEQAEVDGPVSPYRVLPAGYRFCTENGRVLIPDSPPRVAKGMEWAELLRVVRRDLDSVDRLNAARRLARPQQRVRALMDWVQRRRTELAQGPSSSDLTSGGWYELTTNVFDWIFADASPAEAWAAVRLYASIHRGETPKLKTPVFATSAGRSLLLEVALDEKHLVGDRERSLMLLSASLNKSDDKERVALVEKLRPVLATKDEDIQIQVTRAIVALQQADGRKGVPAPLPLVNALASAYRSASDSPGRDELALALCQLASAEQYREITGNPAGVCVRLTEFTRVDDEVSFFLDLRTGGMVHEQPMLVLEKLGSRGEVAETKKVPLAVLNLATPWADGVGDSILAVQLDLPKLIAPPKQEPRSTERKREVTPIVYRVRVEGSVGKDSQKKTWRSESKRITMGPDSSSPFR